MHYKENHFKAMGGPVEIKLYGTSPTQLETASNQVEGEIRRLEKKYSRYRDDSVTFHINQQANSDKPFKVDVETAALLDYANIAHDQSDGLFDITSGVLREVWNFKQIKRPPEEEAIKKILKRVGWNYVEWNAPNIRFTRPRMELDFGGYVKEYAADCATTICRNLGVQSGVLNLAGDISVLGPKPDDSPWEIGIRHPRVPETAYAVMMMGSGAIATSGDYERFIIYEGERYCHILNPKTGNPVRAMASVSVCADSCLVAGSASTITMLREGAGPAWIAELGLPYLLIDQNLQASGTITTNIQTNNFKAP